MRRPLEGIKIVECGIYHAGPGGSAILGDLGADIIKIEQPIVGDPIRNQGKIGNLTFGIKGNRSMFCEASNRNKKSVTIDLLTKKGPEIVHRLVKQADVFVTNLRPNALETMKITYPILSNINPKLIYTSVSAFGPKGPDKDLGGFDLHGQARSGFMYSIGEKGMPPLLSQFGIMDQVTAILTSHQITTALFMRERFGMGQEINVSILGSAMFLNYFNVLISLMGDFEVPRHKRSDEYPLRNYYMCSDKRWIMITLTPPDRFWSTFCKAIGSPELENDLNFNTNDKRYKNAKQLVYILDKIFADRPLDQWLHIFSEYDLFACAVNSMADLKNDPQVIENNYIVDFDHPTLGKIKMPGYPAHFSKSWAKTTSAAPELGEHTKEVLTTICDYSENEILQLKKEKII